MRIELEKIRRRLEVELADVRDQLAEKTGQLEDLQAQMIKREEELQKALNRFVTKFIQLLHLLVEKSCYCNKLVCASWYVFVVVWYWLAVLTRHYSFYKFMFKLVSVPYAQMKDK